MENENRLERTGRFTLVELVFAIVILGIIGALAVPAYLSFAPSAKGGASLNDVRSAIPAAEGYYRNTVLKRTAGTYAGINGAVLRHEARGVSSDVKAISLNAGGGYCIEDQAPSSGGAYYYIGGDPGSAIGAGKRAAIKFGACAPNDGGAAAR